MDTYLHKKKLQQQNRMIVLHDTEGGLVMATVLTLYAWHRWAGQQREQVFETVGEKGVIYLLQYQVMH